MIARAALVGLILLTTGVPASASAVCGKILTDQIIQRAVTIACRFDSAAEECAVLKTTRPLVRGVPAANQIAAHHHGLIAINRAYLEKQCKLLINEGLEYADISKILGPQVAPSLIHEARHAVNERNVRGVIFVLEDEVSAYSSEAAIISQLKALYPEAFRHTTDLSADIDGMEIVWRQGGPLGIELNITEAHKNLHRIGSDSGYAALRESVGAQRTMYEKLSKLVVEEGPQALERISNGMFKGRHEADQVIAGERAYVHFLEQEHEMAWAREYFRRDSCRRLHDWFGKPNNCLEQ